MNHKAMSHAELRESFTAASAAQFLGSATGADPSAGHLPAMGISPHTKQREAGALACSPEVFAAEAVAIAQSAREAQKATEIVEQIVKSSSMDSPGQEGGLRGIKNSSFAQSGGGGTPMGHTELRETLLGGSGAAAAAAAAKTPTETSPPPLNSLLSPHGELRESAVGTALQVSIRGTPTNHGILGATPSQLPQALGGSSLSNASFGLSGQTRIGAIGAIGGTSVPRLGVSPFTSNAVPFPLDGAPGAATHTQLRESFSGGAAAAAAAAAVVARGGSDGNSAADAEGNPRNFSFGTTPHTELREGGGILNCSSAAAAAPNVNGDAGAATHTNLRESFSGGAASAAAAAVAAAMRVDRELQKAKEEVSPLFGVSPMVKVSSNSSDPIGLGSSPATAVMMAMGTSQPTAHTMLREGLEGVVPSQGAASDSPSGNGIAPMTSSFCASSVGGRPTLSAPSRGSGMPHQQVRAMNVGSSPMPSESASRVLSAGGRGGGALTLSASLQQRMTPVIASGGAGGAELLGGSSVPLTNNYVGGLTPPVPVRVSPHVQRREGGGPGLRNGADGAVGLPHGLASSPTVVVAAGGDGGGSSNAIHTCSATEYAT